MEDLFRLAVYLRMGERLALTAVIVALALVVAIGFWRSLQRVEFSADKSVGMSGNFVLATPVFVLLALVGYSWVSLNAPVSFSPGGPVADTDPAQLASAQGASSPEFTAVIEGESKSANDLYNQRTRAQLRSLNCLISTSPDMAAQLDGNLTDLRLGLIAGIWQPEWGDFFVFENAVLAFSDDTPNPDAFAVFSEPGHPCAAP